MSFLLFCYRMRVYKSKRAPLLHFSALCDIFRMKFFFSKISSFFPKKNVLRFLSLRYSADLRRSRLVVFCSLASLYGIMLTGRAKLEPSTLTVRIPCDLGHRCLKTVKHYPGKIYAVLTVVSQNVWLPKAPKIQKRTKYLLSRVYEAKKLSQSVEKLDDIQNDST